MVSASWRQRAHLQARHALLFDGGAVGTQQQLHGGFVEGSQPLCIPAGKRCGVTPQGQHRLQVCQADCMWLHSFYLVSTCCTPMAGSAVAHSMHHSAAQHGSLTNRQILLVFCLGQHALLSLQ
jgi:hypothetical protein